MERINCRVCIHYYITWDKVFPNGCKAYGIKSRQMPATVVHQTSAEQCKAFEKKKTNP